LHPSSLNKSVRLPNLILQPQTATTATQGRSAQSRRDSVDALRRTALAPNRDLH
jgi:hypothetical protein